ncbi:MAG: hypothetical protein WC511_03540 [Candidatus Pacearchaeota archaeon]
MNKKNFILFPRNQKGDVSLPILIGLVTLIAAAIIIFIFWDRLDIQAITDEELCYNSVVTRAGILKLSKDISAPALNCKTGAYCISKDGTCEIMSSSTTIIEVETSDDVYYEIADKMESCWSMLGAGKHDYAGGKADKYFYCSNCYQIGFDDSLDMFSNEEIDERELYRYLSQTNISGTDTTYLKYLIGVNAEIMEQNIYLADAEFKKLEIGKQYFITTGIYSDISTWKTAVIGGATAVGAFGIAAIVSLATGGVAVPGILMIVGGVVAASGGAGAGYYVGTIADGDSGQQFLTPTLIEANSDAYESLKCTSILTLS